MREEGIGSTADLVFFALIVSTASLLVLGISPHRPKELSSPYVERTAQGALLAFQEVPVKEFSTLSYTPDLPILKPSKRRFEEKTPAKLITEEILTDPPSILTNNIEFIDGDYRFSKKLSRILEGALDELVGKRFGYRMTIRLKPIPLEGKKAIRSKKVVQDFDEDSQKLGSETVHLDFTISKGWLDELQRKDTSIFNFQPSENSHVRVGTLILTLELWSK